METLTFICGCGHSGTSLLANMFAANPTVYIPLRETDAFLRPDDLEARWSALLVEAERSGRSHLVEKTPRHVRRLRDIRRYAPRARYIVMVREARDVIASIRRRFGTLENGVKRWLSDNQVVARERTAPDVLLLRYEDLVRAPEDEVRRCCTFARIPFDPVMLNYHQQPRLWFGVNEIRKGDGTAGEEHLALRNWQVNQPIFDGSGQWRDLLTAEEAASLPREKLEPLMLAFGYQW